MEGLSSSDTSDDETELLNNEEKKSKQPFANVGMATVLSKLLEEPREDAKRSLFVKLSKKKLVVDSEDVDSHSSRPAGKKKINEEAARDISRSLISKKRKLNHEDHCRVKPNALEKDSERNLSRIATRGVVQLFNAVNEHQNVLDGKLATARSSEAQKDKALKSVTTGTFLDILKSSVHRESKTNNVVEKVSRLSSSKKKARVQSVVDAGGDSDDDDDKWEVVRENYLVKHVPARMRDWDRQEEDADES